MFTCELWHEGDEQRQMILATSKYQLRTKKEKECRVFNKTWTAKYFFTKIKCKAMLKDYNLNRFYMTRREEKYRNHWWRAHLSDILKLQAQQRLFTKRWLSRDAAVRTSNGISHKITRKSKFSDKTLLRRCTEMGWGHRSKLWASAEEQRGQLWPFFYFMYMMLPSYSSSYAG